MEQEEEEMNAGHGGAPGSSHSSTMTIILIVAAGALVVYFFSKSGGAQVYGMANPSDIINANTAANNTAAAEHTAIASDAFNYATAKVQADSAVQQAVDAGNSALAIQRVVTAGNVAMNNAQVSGAEYAARQATVASNYQASQQTKQNWQTGMTARVLGQQAASSATAIAQAQANANIQAAQAQASAQSNSAFWNFMSNIGGVITSLFHFNIGGTAPTTNYPTAPTGSGYPISYTPVPTAPTGSATA